MVLFAVVAGSVGERSPEPAQFTTYQVSGTHYSFASEVGIYVADPTQHPSCTTTNQDGQHVPTSMTRSGKIVLDGQSWYMVGTIEPGKDDLVLNVSCPDTFFAVGDPADVLAGPDLTNVPGLVLGFGVITLGVLALHVGSSSGPSTAVAVEGRQHKRTSSSTNSHATATFAPAVAHAHVARSCWPRECRGRGRPDVPRHHGPARRGV